MEQVDISDLKSEAEQAYEFDSRPGYQRKKEQKYKTKNKRQ